jgi:hypothetical protein
MLLTRLFIKLRVGFGFGTVVILIFLIYICLGIAKVVLSFKEQMLKIWWDGELRIYLRYRQVHTNTPN